VGDRASRDQILATLAERTLSELVQRVGNIGVFYRKNNELAKIVLPD
jgi:RNA-binding protein YhbY